jgi:hypothetical protein
MAMTWGQLKAVAVAAALPDTAAVMIELDVPGGTGTPPVPGYAAASVAFQKTVDAAIVQSGKMIWS